MLKHAERLAAKRSDLAFELVPTDAFLDSLDADEESYSRNLMDSRISLVPRGTATDTYRLSQSLRAGCVAVADAVPRHPWFYDDAPIVRVGDWKHLEGVLAPLLADPQRLEDLHARSLEWWRTRGSPEAVGAYMAGKLNALAP
jgi:hypothetical protein